MRGVAGIRRAVAAVALVLGLAACGGPAIEDLSASVAAATTTAPAPANDGQQEYSTVPDVVEDLETAGVPCTNYRTAEAPSQAVAQGSCFVAGDEIVIALHSSIPERDAMAANIIALLSSLPNEYRVIVGGNWLVNVADSPTWSQVRDAMGGGRVLSTGP